MFDGCMGTTPRLYYVEYKFIKGLCMSYDHIGIYFFYYLFNFNFSKAHKYSHLYHENIFIVQIVPYTKMNKDA